MAGYLPKEQALAELRHRFQEELDDFLDDEGDYDLADDEFKQEEGFVEALIAHVDEVLSSAQPY